MENKNLEISDCRFRLDDLKKKGFQEICYDDVESYMKEKYTEYFKQLTIDLNEEYDLSYHKDKFYKFSWYLSSRDTHESSDKHFYMRYLNYNEYKAGPTWYEFSEGGKNPSSLSLRYIHSKNKYPRFSHFYGLFWKMNGKVFGVETFYHPAKCPFSIKLIEKDDFLEIQRWIYGTGGQYDDDNLIRQIHQPVLYDEIIDFSEGKKSSVYGEESYLHHISEGRNGLL